MHDKRVHKLILGGGISGISLAHFSADDDYLIVEKEESLGGLCRSFRIGDSIFDFSGHFMHFKDAEMKKYVEGLLAKHQTGEFKEYARNAGIYMKVEGENRLIDYPFQANVHQLSKEDFADALADLYEATHTTYAEKATNFAELARRAFGTTILEKFIRPYNEKLYCSSLDTLDPDAMGRFIPTVKFDEVMRNIKEKKNFGYNSTFLYSPSSGIQGVVDAFAKERPLNVSLGETVTKIDVEARVVYTDKCPNGIKYDVLFNTLPLPLFNRLARLPSLDLKSVDVHVYNITYTKKVSSIKDMAWVYFPEDTLFYRVGFYDHMSQVPKTSVYVEVSTKTGDADAVVPTIEMIDQDLKKSGVIDNDAVIEVSQQLLMSPAYAILETDALTRVKDFVSAIARQDVFFTGRYGKWAYQSIEDNILDARNLMQNYDYSIAEY